MLCPDCNKFAAYDMSADPEFDLDVNEQGEVTGSVRIVLSSECCGSELKEATFDIDEDFSETFKDCLDENGELKEGHELEVEGTGEISDRLETSKTKILKSGKVVTQQIPYRYAKRYFGVAGTINAKCSCGKEAEKEYTDEIQASSMDELV